MSPRPEPPAESASDSERPTGSAGHSGGAASAELSWLLLDHLWLEPCESAPCYRLTGEPGATNAIGGFVWLVNLDSELAATTGPVEPDGSFVLAVDASPRDELRVQVRGGARRSEPMDLVVATGAGRPERAQRPLAGCLVLQPATEVDVAPTATLRVLNACSPSIRLVRIGLRRAVPELVVRAPLAPIDLASGQSVSIEFDRVSGAAVGTEEILFVEASAPDRDRRPLTVHIAPSL